MPELKCEEVFEQMYNHRADGLTFCPYRICPLGAHIDHQFGWIITYRSDFFICGRDNIFPVSFI